jgi:hypothetical protein
MTKPTLITNPRRVTVYLPELVATRGREIAKQSGISLSQLMSDLLSGQAASMSKVRIHADFPSDEFDTIKQVACDLGMSVEDLVRTATYTLLDTRP